MAYPIATVKGFDVAYSDVMPKPPPRDLTSSETYP
jgi:hypothetical protein